MTNNLKQEEVSFIMVYNSFLSENTIQHLTDKELYLYGLLYREIGLSKEVRTSVSILSDFSPIKFNKRKSREVAEMKELLKSLINKNVVLVSNANGEPFTEDFKATDSIVVSFLPTPTRYFTKIPFDKFESFETIRNFYIYTIVKRWANSDYFECNYDRWADLLRCSRPSAIKYIEEAVKKGIIFKNTGDYKEDELIERPQKIQSMNQYKVTPFTDEEKTRITMKKDYLEEKAKKKVEEDKVDEVVVEFPTKKRAMPVNVSDMF